MEAINIISEGLGFQVAPKNIPIKNIIYNIEDGIHDLFSEEKGVLRQECSLIMGKSKPTKSNLNKDEKFSLKSLCNNDKIVVLKVDKGRAVVVLDNNDYILKMNENISCSSYRKLNKNPLPKVLKEVKKAILESSLDEKLKKRLIPWIDSNNEVWCHFFLLRIGFLYRTLKYTWDWPSQEPQILVVQFL